MIDHLSLQTGSEYPVLATVSYTVLLAFVLSTLIAVTYERTTAVSDRPVDFIPALILASIVASIIIQAVGDSLAVGLGLLGALAIIRFRNNLQNPRDIIFIFTSLAAGIACGVFGYTISVVGTLSFCLIAWVLHFSPYDRKRNVQMRLRFRLPAEAGHEHSVRNLMRQHCRAFVLDEARYRTIGEVEEAEYQYRISLRSHASATKLMELFREMPGVKDIRMDRVIPL